MKRWFVVGVAALVAVGGLLFSLINAARVVLDLHFARLELPLGVLVLGCLLLGAVLAGLVLHLGVILPLRLRLASMQRQARAADAGSDRA